MSIITPFGSRRTYNDFKRQIPDSVLPLFDQIRDYCFSLDDKVIEDVRMHRIVFCKSMTFRWFLDVEPQKDGVALKIQRSRKTPVQIIHIKNSEKPDFARIKEAFEEIH